MFHDKHWSANNYFVFIGLSCGFFGNRKRHITDQMYVVIIVFIILR